MGSEIVTKGLVLHEMPIGDYDKRLILLTKEFGKITAFAKGSRKPNSRLLASSQVFSYCDFYLYKGKQAYNINQAHLINSFHNLRLDIDTLAYGLYILEFTEYITVENVKDHNLMKLILKTLKQLEIGHIPIELIVNIFELKAMSYIGFSPWIHSCIICNSTENMNYFSLKEGGILCSNCFNKDSKVQKINEGTRYTIEYILNSNNDSLFNFRLENDIYEEFKLVIKYFIDYNLNKKFKSLEFLKK